jgi:dihydropteroate synthase
MLLEQGAHILDLGAQSSRPGAKEIAPEEEQARLLPVLRRLREDPRGREATLAVDANRASTARLALEAGADIINDIYALRRVAATPGAPTAREVVARHPACGVCLAHLHGDPQTMQRTPMTGDAVPQVLLFLEQAAKALQGLGVQKSRIVLDPGIGFGKTVAQNFALLARQRELLALGYPLLVGWSRKSALGAALVDAQGRAPPPPQRGLASVAAALLAIERGARIVRVHDVAATAQAFKIWSAMNHEATFP